MQAWHEMDGNADIIRSFSVIEYANYKEDTDTWEETYVYYEGEEERDISEQEYDEFVFMMSNDDQIEWHDFMFSDSTLRYAQY